MKSKYLLFFLFPFHLASAQIPTGTDIFIANCKIENAKLSIEQPENISNREGYDNQPYFSEDGKLIYYVAIKEDKQADIYTYSIPNKTTNRLTQTSESEYSPRIISNGKHLTVVRVEKDSSQRFQNYQLANLASSPICFTNDSIGYYTWLDASNYLFFKITQPPSLWLSNSKTCTEKFLTDQVGRCLIPNSKNEFYFTQLQDSVRWICSYNIAANKITNIVECINGSEDFVTLDAQHFIMGSGSKIYEYNLNKAKNWQEISDFQQFNIKNIKRITINKDKNKIAFVNDSGNP